MVNPSALGRYGSAMDETPLRCPADRALVAVLRADVVLQPIRLGRRKAQQMGVARTGLFWRRVEGSSVVCRRCGRRYATKALTALAASRDAEPSRTA